MQSLRAVPACSAALAALALWAAVAVGAPAAQASPIVTPHRAVYDLSLLKSRGEGPVTQARGRLEFEWADVCSGWTVHQRTRVEVFYAEGAVVDFGWTLTAFESKDGQHYRFFIRRFDASGPSEELRGEARLSGPGAGGVATFSEPEAREVVLPAGTMFPTAHSLLLIETAEGDALPVWRVVFDGSGDEGLFGVSAVISHPLPADGEAAVDSPLVRGQRSWRLHMAYFGMDETVAEPEHEQTLRLFANGVVDQLVLDYGDFALQGDLTEIESQPPPEC